MDHSNYRILNAFELTKTKCDNDTSQENYLKTEPSKLKNESGPEKSLRHLQLMYRAASSISDGDLVDALIHGYANFLFASSLLVTHTHTDDDGMMILARSNTGRSCRCMPFVLLSDLRRSCMVWAAGMEALIPLRSLSKFSPSSSGGSPLRSELYRWLGQNSKQNKLNRQLIDMQARVRLKVSGDKNELRQSYVPTLFGHIVKPLMDNGAVSILSRIFLRCEETDKRYVIERCGRRHRQNGRLFPQSRGLGYCGRAWGR